MSENLKLIPSDARITSGAQASDLQRLAYNVGVKLNKQLGKSKSLQSTLALASAVEKVCRVWQSSHEIAASKRARRNGHTANGHAPKPAPGATPRPAPPAPLDEPESKESLLRPDPPHTPPPRGESEGAPHLSSLPPES